MLLFSCCWESLYWVGVDGEDCGDAYEQTVVTNSTGLMALSNCTAFHFGLTIDCCTDEEIQQAFAQLTYIDGCVGGSCGLILGPSIEADVITFPVLESAYTMAVECRKSTKVSMPALRTVTADLLVSTTGGKLASLDFPQLLSVNLLELNGDNPNLVDVNMPHLHNVWCLSVSTESWKNVSFPALAQISEELDIWGNLAVNSLEVLHLPSLKMIGNLLHINENSLLTDITSLIREDFTCTDLRKTANIKFNSFFCDRCDRSC
ncbi:hypothetical protein Pelo_5642 [Pelomyxa schiedti]|nr:hypothetical protein Pelo_5642 [Pelomyxa schiedti]